MSPLVCADLYETVTGRSDGKCQCRDGEPGGCGNERHPVTGRWCYERQRAGAPLYVVPIDPTTPDHVAVTLGPDELIALCRACYVRRRNRARKAREEQLAAEFTEAQGELFTLDDTERTAS